MSMSKLIKDFEKVGPAINAGSASGQIWYSKERNMFILSVMTMNQVTNIEGMANIMTFCSQLNGLISMYNNGALIKQ